MVYRQIGACGSCPSSTTTMKMGIERVLKEKFGDAINDICQVNVEQITETTVEVSSRIDGGGLFCLSDESIHVDCNVESMVEICRQ